MNIGFLARLFRVLKSLTYTEGFHSAIPILPLVSCTWVRGGQELGPRVLRREDREGRQDSSLHSDTDMLGLCKMYNC